MVKLKKLQEELALHKSRLDRYLNHRSVGSGWIEDGKFVDAQQKMYEKNIALLEQKIEKEKEKLCQM